MVGRRLRDRREILCDRGQLHTGQIGQIRAIIGDDLQLVGNGNSAAQRFAHAERRANIGADHGIDAVGRHPIKRTADRTMIAGEIHHLTGLDILILHARGGQFLFQREVVAHRRERGLSQIERPLLDFAADRQIEELIARTANHHHMARAIANQHLRNQSPTLLVVRSDRRNTISKHAIECDDRAVDGRPIIAGMRGVSAHDDAVHHVPAQHIDVLDFAVRLVGGGAQHGAQPLRGERMLQVRGKRCKERVTNGGHDDADQIRAIVVQVAGKLVWHVIEGLHGLTHAVAHVVGYIPVAVHHQ